MPTMMRMIGRLMANSARACPFDLPWRFRVGVVGFKTSISGALSAGAAKYRFTARGHSLLKELPATIARRALEDHEGSALLALGAAIARAVSLLRLVLGAGFVFLLRPAVVLAALRALILAAALAALLLLGGQPEVLDGAAGDTDRDDGKDDDHDRPQDANPRYEPFDHLHYNAQPPKRVRSCERGPVKWYAPTLQRYLTGPLPGDGRPAPTRRR